jgi:hypothetical protein
VRFQALVTINDRKSSIFVTTMDVSNEHREAIGEGCLLIDYCGEMKLLETDETLTFGRSAELDIDDNAFLHRQLGRFEWRDGRWWLVNTGSRIELEMFDRTTHASARLTPGTAQMLPGEDLLVHFSAGPTRYELLVTGPPTEPVETAEPSDTVGLHLIPWTHEQRLLMTVLAESLLRNPHQPLQLPTNVDARTRLAWSTAKFNRKLDNLCERLTGLGVRGLDKGVGARNNDRRRILAEVAIDRGILSDDDLAALDQYGAEVSTQNGERE